MTTRPPAPSTTCSAKRPSPPTPTTASRPRAPWRTSTSPACELRLYPDLIGAFAMVKLAAARANVDCGQSQPRAS